MARLVKLTIFASALALAGLGASVERPRVRVQWPDGQAEEWTDVAIDQYTTLVKGTGR